MSRTFMISAAILTALAASPSLARGPVVVTAEPDRVVRHISYADLNLAVPAGERVLQARVRGGIRGLCDEIVPGGTTDLNSILGRKDCSRDAWEQADPQIAAAIQRAREIASTGTSTIAASAIVISLGH
ncbi:UrcA family protein [Sphingomonas ginkgonis]|nr:UrcA family protein [Sphingomonas ginkgonis]